MSSSGKGDANSYWPGFVDALTNVVIAMIFVVVVLAISLSFAARLMGQKLADQYIKEHQAKAALAPATPAAPPPPASAAPVPDAAVPVVQRIAVAGNEGKATSTKAASVSRQDRVFQLDYAPGAVTLDTAAADQFKQALARLGPVAAGTRVMVVASGPDMALTDNQRTAYLRVMAVRNLLIESGFPPDRIGMEVDTRRETAAPAVNLSFSSAP